MPGNTFSPPKKYPLSSLSSSDKPDIEAQIVREIPAQRLGEVGETPATCVYLCSDAARYVNDADLVVDGGISLGNWIPIHDPV